MKITKRKILFLAVAIVAGFAAAQMLVPATPAPVQFFPRGALVYWETGNLKEFLLWWKNSQLRQDWQKTYNYRSFENSRLYLRLKERITDFGKEKYKFSLDNLIKLSGRRSALAIYDIGNLKALAVTEVSQADAALTELWISRGKFHERNFNGHVYYTEPQEGKLAFAYAKPFFIISTETALLEEFLKNSDHPDQSSSLAASEKWGACRPDKDVPALFSIFVDQESLNQNRYFRRYWIHGNVKELAPIRSAWIDFLAEPKGLLEHRHFALTGTTTDSKPEDFTQSAEWLSAFQELKADFLVIEPAPDPQKAAEGILKLLNKFPDRQQQTSYPPAYAASFERATEAEAKNPYLVRIDDPVLEPTGLKILENDQPSRLTSLLTTVKPVVKIRLTTPLWDNDGLFMRFQETQILLLQNYDGLQQQELLNQLQEHLLLLTSAGNNVASWIRKTGESYELHSFIALFVHFHKPWVVISNTESELNRAVAVLPSQPISPRVSYTAINWEKNRWKYSRLMRRLDYGVYRGDEPLFFSENLDSLFQALYPIKQSTLEKTVNTEVIHYEIR